MIAMRTIIYFLVTSLISAIIGLVLVLLIHPGNPETKATLGNGNTEARTVDIVDNFMDLGRNLFPDNMFKASFQTVIIFFFPKYQKLIYHGKYFNKSDLSTLNFVIDILVKICEKKTRLKMLFQPKDEEKTKKTVTMTINLVLKL